MSFRSVGTTGARSSDHNSRTLHACDRPLRASNAPRQLSALANRWSGKLTPVRGWAAARRLLRIEFEVR